MPPIEFNVECTEWVTTAFTSCKKIQYNFRAIQEITVHGINSIETNSVNLFLFNGIFIYSYLYESVKKTNKIKKSRKNGKFQECAALEIFPFFS